MVRLMVKNMQKKKEEYYGKTRGEHKEKKRRTLGRKVLDLKQKKRQENLPFRLCTYI